MNQLILSDLSQAFTELLNKPHLYIEADSQKLIKSDQKKLTMAEVFTRSLDYIRFSDSAEELKKFKDLGKKLYTEKYCATTKVWMRSVLKLIHFIFPQFFSHIDQKEQETQKAFDLFNQTIDLKYDILKKKNEAPLSPPKYEPRSRRNVTITPDGCILQMNQVLKHPDTLQVQIKDLEKFITIMSEKPKKEEETTQFTNLKASLIEIDFAGQQLDSKTARLLLTSDLKEFSLALKSVVVDFNALENFSFDEKKCLLNLMAKTPCPDLRRIVLGDEFKEITASEWTNFLVLYPSSNLFKQCYVLCEKREEIGIPSSLVKSGNLDLSNCPETHLFSLLSHFAHPQIIDLSGTSITNEQIYLLMKTGYFDETYALNLDNCPNLTSDVIEHLNQFPKLSTLKLDQDLKLGDPSKLPRFENPFKIALFYTQPKCLRSQANELYQGPSNWATIFQILLAREGERQVFSKNHHVIDPKSVAHWHHKSDYEKLEPQEAIDMLIADHNEKVHIDFIKKFPNLRHLSLYNCSCITEEWIGDLISYLLNNPSHQLESIDLTDCPIDPNSQVVSNLRELCGIKQVICEKTSFQLDNQTLRNAHRLNLNQQLNEQLQYQSHEKENWNENNCKPWATSFIQNQIALYLFQDEVKDQINLINVTREIIDPLEDKYRDRQIILKDEKFQGSISSTYLVHQEVLYSQSAGFRAMLRPGGDLFNLHQDIENQHFTPNASQYLIDLIYGKEVDIGLLDGDTALHLTKLVEPTCFDMPAYLPCLHQQFWKRIDDFSPDEKMVNAYLLDENL